MGRRSCATSCPSVGSNYNLNQRMERQLGLRQSKLAEMFGEKVIADVAMIGTDTFLREGAAIGVMFQARNSPALMADFTQQRTTAVKETKGAKLETITIAGRPVSFISTPDNALRSFFVSDGDFHLITTSRTIAEWFLQTGAGKHESLGASEDFRLRANQHAAGTQRHGVRLLLARLLPEPDQRALPDRAQPPAALRGRDRPAAHRAAGRARRGPAAR